MSESLLVTDLPGELLSACLARLVDPADLARAFESAVAFAETRDDSSIWKAVARAQYDDLHVRRKLVHFIGDEERSVHANEIDWAAEIKRRHRLARIIRNGSEDERLATLEDVARCCIGIAANAAHDELDVTPSKNANWLSSVFASDEALEFYFFVDHNDPTGRSRVTDVHPRTRSRAQLDNARADAESAPTTDTDRVLLARFHCLRGLFERGPGASLHRCRGRARELVYDLARMSSKTHYGPYLESGCVDWEMVEACATVSGCIADDAQAEWHLEMQNAPIFSVDEGPRPEVRVPFGWQTSLPWPAVLPTGPATSDDMPFDWIGLDRVLVGSYGFLDFRQLRLYNLYRDEHGNRPRLDRDIEGSGDCMRMRLHQTAAPTRETDLVPPELCSSERPPLYFAGRSISAMHLVTSVRGEVHLTPDRQIAYTLIIGYESADRWRLKGVQLGQNGPIVGLWSDLEDDDGSGPVGPFCYWRPS